MSHFATACKYGCGLYLVDSDTRLLIATFLHNLFFKIPVILLCSLY